MGYRLAYDLKEFSYKAKAVSGGIEQSLDIGGLLNLSLSH